MTSINPTQRLAAFLGITEPRTDDEIVDETISMLQEYRSMLDDLLSERLAMGDRVSISAMMKMKKKLFKELN